MIRKYDIAIIGAGITGALIARELSKYDASVCILEKSEDVAAGATKANSAIIHGGFDPAPGTLKAKLNVQGCSLIAELTGELGVKYKNNGSMVVAFSDEEMVSIKELYGRGLENGVKGLRILGPEEALKEEPNLSENVCGALLCSSSGIVCPYELCIAAVGNAMDNGVDLITEYEVKNIEYDSETGLFCISGGEDIYVQYVLNCAGLYADSIAHMIGDHSFALQPKKGEYMLLDKTEGKLTTHTLFQVPTKLGKGVLVTPTVDGNILLGPTSDVQEDKEDKDTTACGLSVIRKFTAKTTDKILYNKVITAFSGLRAAVKGDGTADFIIAPSKVNEKFLNIAGIDSPGLSSAPAIALYVADMLKECGAIDGKKKNHVAIRESDSSFSRMSFEQKNELIQKDPRYGHIICRCECVSEGEIVEAIHRNPPARSLDALKKRVRTGMGRCQGGFCTSYLLDILSREWGLPAQEITKRGGGSHIVDSKLKETLEYTDEKPESGKHEAKRETEYDIVIVGGGAAGMAAALKAHKQGVQNIMIIERNEELGGILQQCIHDGFGLHKFGEQLTGPEYAMRYIKEIKDNSIPYMLSTTVLAIDADNKVLTVMNSERGIFKISAKTIILAMGCRERTRGAICTPGSRPSGIFTAGTAQKLINIKGYMPGKTVLILGSGDIGLIMARRLTLEGAKVKAVCEIMPFSNGLSRNIQQCLKDYDIPLKLSHTITQIHGQDRVTGVMIAQVDDHLKVIEGTEQYIECDTVLLSCGLIPENDLIKDTGIRIDRVTSGAYVNEKRETCMEGIYACGNVLHVHDLVDFVSDEGEIAGSSAAMYVCGDTQSDTICDIHAVNGARYTIPQSITSDKQSIKVYFRVAKLFRNVSVLVNGRDGNVLLKKKKLKMAPGEMESIDLTPDMIRSANGDIYISIDQGGKL